MLRISTSYKDPLTSGWLRCIIRLSPIATKMVHTPTETCVPWDVITLIWGWVGICICPTPKCICPNSKCICPVMTRGDCTTKWCWCKGRVDWGQETLAWLLPTIDWRSTSEQSVKSQALLKGSPGWVREKTRNVQKRMKQDHQRWRYITVALRT